MERRALVTGAGGFIGSHLAERLVGEGYGVRALVHYNALGRTGWLADSPREIRETLDIVAGDIRDPAFMRRAMDGVDVVFHLAALIGIPYSYLAPDSYIAVNVQGTLNVLEAARDVGAKVVHTSTSEVYGTAQRVPIGEDHPLSAQSPYAASKIGADQLALSFHRSFGVPVAVVRPFNTYGPRQSARAVIPTIILQLLADPRRIALGNLAPTRDLTLVDDTVAGFVAADRAEAALGEVVNLGTGYEISIGALAARIAEEMGVEPVIEQAAARVRTTGSEVERLLSDNRRAADLLGWRPRLAGADGLAAGLRSTVGWFRARGADALGDAARYRV